MTKKIVSFFKNVLKFSENVTGEHDVLWSHLASIHPSHPSWSLHGFPSRCHGLMSTSPTDLGPSAETQATYQAVATHQKDASPSPRSPSSAHGAWAAEVCSLQLLPRHPLGTRRSAESQSWPSKYPPPTNLKPVKGTKPGNEDGRRGTQRGAPPRTGGQQGGSSPEVQY